MEKTTLALLSIILVVGLIAGIFLSESLTGNALFNFKKTSPMQKEQTMTKTQCLEAYSPWTELTWEGVNLDLDTQENTFEHRAEIQFSNKDKYTIKFAEIILGDRAVIRLTRDNRPLPADIQSIYLTQNETYNYRPQNTIKTLQIKAKQVIDSDDDLQDTVVIAYRFI